MTVPPPPAVPGELIEKAAKALYEATREPSYTDPAYDWPNIDTGYDKPDEAITDPEWCRNAYRADAEAVLAAVYGGIVEAARRDALTQAADAIRALDPHEAGDGDSFEWSAAVDEAARILTDLRDATLRSAP